MFKANYGDNGGLVTLGEFIDLQNGETDPKKWRVKPTCPCCGKEVDARSFLSSEGWKVAAVQVTKERKNTSYFSHKKNSNSFDCSLYHPNKRNSDNNDKFKLAKQHFNRRYRKQVEQVLFSSENKQFTLRVVAELKRELTLKKTPLGNYSEIEKFIQKRNLTSMVALSRHPWLLPFMFMCFQINSERISDPMGSTFAYFKADGTQKVVFKDFDNIECFAEIPEYIKLVLNTDGFKEIEKVIPVSHESANKLAAAWRPERWGREYINKLKKSNKRFCQIPIFILPVTTQPPLPILR